VTEGSAPLILFSPAAEEDLHEIGAYLAGEVGDAAAEAILVRVRAKCESLSRFPDRYPLVGFAPQPMRCCQCEAWHIFYRSGRDVEIVRVIHQSRDIAATLAMS